MVKWSRYRRRGIALLFHDRSTRRGEWSAARSGHTLPPGKTQYPFYRRLGGPQGRSWRAENLVPTGIRSRTIQPVVSRYTDWATRPIITLYYNIIILWEHRRTCGPSLTETSLCGLYLYKRHSYIKRALQTTSWENLFLT